MEEFHFDPNLSTAATIPANWYTDPARWPLEQARIFRRTWQYACALERLRFPGNYVAVDVVGAPVVLTRDLDGALHAFYNVCRHRAGMVAKGAGNRKTLQCLYHGWLYNLDGSLRNAPEFEQVEHFDPCAYGLAPLRVETWGPFVFVNMDQEAPPLLEVLGAIPAETQHFDFAGMRLVEHRDYWVNANWKVYIDNYLEGYHIPVAHPGLYREIDYARYRVDTFRYYSSQYAPIRPVRSEDAAGRVYSELQGDEQAFYYWIFPNFMLNLYPGTLQINLIVPVSHEQTLTIFEWFFADPGTPESWNALQTSIEFSDQVQREDMEICAYVWRNLQVGVYEQGRYSVKRENGVHHFHGLLAEFLA
ncbi:MAG TPA: aromatic ring-hydroxylating dioxygenase subunit alpha [Caldilineaceae bacterium]|nr:aromatic ring-hydroxylating dioxygenase subunit alpha [Caldilineaceae bacterium]